jgi:hypothetical protein
MTNKDDAHLLHHQRSLLDEITTTLAYAKAMAAVAIGSDFHQYEIHIIHNYLGGIHSLLEKIDEMQQQLMKTFYSIPMVGHGDESAISSMPETEEK